MSSPLALSDEQIDTLTRIAAPLAPKDRTTFLADVARAGRPRAWRRHAPPHRSRNAAPLLVAGDRRARQQARAVIGAGHVRAFLRAALRINAWLALLPWPSVLDPFVENIEGAANPFYAPVAQVMSAMRAVFRLDRRQFPVSAISRDVE